MNYQNIYNALVEKAKARGLDKSQHEGYHESHHIVPKCLGGNNSKSNLVLFTAREHFIAHWLLWKCNPSSTALMRAFWLMSHTRDSIRSSKVYAHLKQEYSDSAKVTMTKMRKDIDLTKNKASMFKDLVGKINNSLTVISFSHWEPTSQNKQGVSFWNLKCICGNIVVKRGTSFTNGKVKSCGCQPNPSRVRPPWERYTEDNETAHKIKWSLADKYYHAWVASEKLSKSKFLTFYNKLNLTDLPKSYFNSIVDNFTNGWIPLEDEDWLKFSKGV